MRPCLAKRWTWRGERLRNLEAALVGMGIRQVCVRLKLLRLKAGDAVARKEEPSRRR